MQLFTFFMQIIVHFDEPFRGFLLIYSDYRHFGLHNNLTHDIPPFYRRFLIISRGFFSTTTPTKQVFHGFYSTQVQRFVQNSANSPENSNSGCAGTADSVLAVPQQQTGVPAARLAHPLPFHGGLLRQAMDRHGIMSKH